MNAKIALSGMVAIAGLHAFAVREVSSIDGLKSAIEAVNNGTSSDTTIRMAAGTYTLSSEMTPMTSDGKAFFEIKKSMTIEGSDTTSWRASGDNETGVVFDGGTYSGSIFKLTPTASDNADNVKDVIFKHLTLRNANSTLGGAAIAFYHTHWRHDQYLTNCVFKSNMTSGQGGAVSYFKALDCLFAGNASAKDGGAMLMPALTLNCVFDGNEAQGTSRGGAIRGGGTIRGCQFLRNKAGTSSAVYGSNWTMTDCVCATNESTWGGCVRLEDTTKTATVSGCRFEGNVGKGSADAGCPGACMYIPVVTNSVFVGNRSSYRNGGACIGCPLVVGCAFTNNTSGAGYSGSAVYQCNTVRDCDFYDNSTQNTNENNIDKGGCCREATFVTNCMFRNVSVGVRGGAYACTNVVDCTFENCGAIGNASVVKCGFFGHSIQSTEKYVLSGGTFTNCLVTGCSEDYVIGADSGATELVNCTIVSNNQVSGGQILAGTVRAVNTIFKDNYKNGSGDVFDVAGYGTWYFTNCIYKTHPNWSSTYYFNDTDCIYDTAKLFEDSTRPKYDTAHPYKLRTNSPAVNAGLAIPGMAALTDYSGAGRVNGDRIDIGCYECWLKPLGFTLVFR